VPDDRTNHFLKEYRGLGFHGHPCLPSDIELIERYVGMPLPAAYRAFLLLMGRKPDSYFDGTDCSLSRLTQMQAAAHQLLVKSGNPFVLPANAFAFWMYQGYQFMYFLCEPETDDPAVFHYIQNESDALRTFGTFSEWLRTCSIEK
jgi:SMI1 / KNR4 family (SUKH-1)